MYGETGFPEEGPQLTQNIETKDRVKQAGIDIVDVPVVPHWDYGHKD